MNPSRDPRSLSRRGFIQTGVAGLTALQARAAWGDAPPPRAKHVITLLLVGSPAPLDTFDPKPAAPAEIRGPFASIPTAIPGVRFCEHLPRLAALADRLAIVRSLHHPLAPLHETGQRLVQTGRDFGPADVAPFAGSIVAWQLGPLGNLPAAVLLPGPLRDCGAGPLHGQSAAWLGPRFEPAAIDPIPPSHGAESPLSSAVDSRPEPRWLREHYGTHSLGRCLLAARRLVERGVRHVTVNQFVDLFDTVTWDMHANGGRLNTTFADYRQRLLPELDQALSALLIDLENTGLLDETLVCVTAEMGRTPRINARGGRDHHAGVWTHLLAGGAIPRGAVIGTSDPHGIAPADRPVTPAQFLATIYHQLGLDPRLLGLGHCDPIV